MQSLFLYNFTKHVKWDEAGASNFTIGIYGNSEDGIITDLALNKQTAASEILRVEDSLKRIWWAFGIMAAAMIGNLVKNLFF